ncbi:MAG TPA: right-handed parallel beta-helix repeat-containing protein [Thermoanaerobaculia bacterium]|nr:right-handed parallel beta-helix repeat-containing protein [Thermoanaerobaculia bacterium]
MKRSKVVAAVFALVVTSTTAHAATVYVSTSGNDANAGTLNAPFRTITRAAWGRQPGDIVEVRGGTYSGKRESISEIHGTANARIVFRPYAGEKVIIDGTGTPAATDLVSIYQSSYVDFTGFEVRNATRIGITSWNSHNVRIAGNTVHHCVRNGIYAGADTFGISHDIVVDGNTVYNNVLENRNRAFPDGGWATGITIAYSTNSRATNNKVYQNDGEGIVTLLSSDNLIENNEIFDNFSVGVYVDNARRITVNRNLIYSTGNTSYYRDGYPASGIATANEWYEASLPSSDLVATNNIIVNTRWGFFYGAFQAGGGLKNAMIANNTFYKAVDEMIWIEADAHANSVFQNNIFHEVSPRALPDINGGGVTFRSNLWYGSAAGAALGEGDIIGNPLFVNAGGYKASDYRLTALSPAQHRAIATPAATDYFGNTRTLAYDLGAHELSVETGSSATTTLLGPEQLTATATGTSTVRLRWNEVANATGYGVYRNGTRIATATSASYSDGNLTPGTRYTYEVTAIVNGSESIRSAVQVATQNAKDSVPPSAVSDLAAAVVGATSVTLTWQAATDDSAIELYEIYRNGELVTRVSGTVYTDASVKPATQYEYAVVAYDVAGNQSAPATLSVKTRTTKRRAV